MKKVIDLAEIEAREKELEDELAKLRAIKKYANKFGADYGNPQSNGGNVADSASIVSPDDAENRVWSLIVNFRNPEFNCQTIETALADSGIKVGRSSIFDAVASLKKKGRIEVVRAGAGRRPAQYRISPASLAASLNTLRKDAIE